MTTNHLTPTIPPPQFEPSKSLQGVLVHRQDIANFLTAFAAMHNDPAHFRTIELIAWGLGCVTVKRQ